MDDTVVKVALAGLLHDIGKFIQRAEVPLSSSAKGMESSICKIYKGCCIHRHALWTKEFFEIFSVHPILGTVLDQDSIANLATFHHNPATKLQEIIQLADYLSSGNESQEEDEAFIDGKQHKKGQLQVIFDYLQLGECQNSIQKFSYELAPMDNSMESCFPTNIDDNKQRDGEKIVSAYGDLWECFCNEMKQIKTRNSESFLAVLLSLLEKYTWCIPSTTADRHDISLFDHAKNTAAIATALYRYHQAKGDLVGAPLSIHNETDKFRLLVGDLSGIQNYIFNIRNVGVGGTAKRLRARSFYLSVLADVASHALLHDFGLPITNLVIASGGKFYLLIPNTPAAEETIAKRDRAFSRWLIDNLNGEIALNLASVSFSSRDMLDFNNVLKLVNEALQISKERAFTGCLMAEDGWQTDAFLLSDRKFEADEELCPSCRKFPGTHKKEEGVVLCHHCAEDMSLGTDLARAFGVQFFLGKHGDHEIFDEYSFSIAKHKKDFSNEAYLIQQFNNWEIGATTVALRPRPFANYVPLFDEAHCGNCGKSECADKKGVTVGSPKYFTCLAEASHGRKTLGVFKADVDNLGLIFIKGFRTEEEKCITRITTLSRLLEGFFTGRLDYLLRSEFRDMYTVFAGGDDLLMLGPWDQALRFSRRVRAEFGQFTCGNPAFTLSAGVAVVKPRLPIYAAIGYAEDLLDKAKEQCATGAVNPKNQLSIMGDIIKWDKVDTLQQEADRLAAWQKGKNLSMGFVRLLLDSSEHFRAFKKTGKTSHLRFVPMLAYGIARNIPAKEADIVKWVQELTDLESKNLRHLTFIANYSIQTNRS
ncbi:MAG: type III-A CRISPR-associated protein Cas10/Csm1 [Syntrophales bacterium]